MANRTAYPATEVDGNILTAANFDKLPGGLIGYASTTGNQTGITTITDLTNLTVTVTVGASRLIRVCGCITANCATNTGLITLSIRESSTTLSQVQTSLDTAGDGAGMFAEYLAAAPSTGSHTYKLSLTAGFTSGGLVATATQLSYITVYDEGPSF